MKTSRIFIAAFAVALSLVSCTKENADQKNSSSTSEPRVFTLEFSKQTRTTLNADGITPEWTNGDKIWISNTESGEEVSVTVSGDKATITTTLKGTLKAVYPSSAATKNGTVITGISVPATQHGTFAESNICMAENIAEGAETITFENKTAVLCFYVDESIGVSKIEIEGTGVATDQNKITVTPSSGTTLYEVGGGPDKRICYAAVLPVSGKEIKLTGTATSQTQPRTIPSAKLAANKIYNAFIPYYIKIKVSDNPETYQKWGYCNVGAFLPEEYGEYFAWGETTGHAAATNGENAFVSGFTDNSKGFSWSNAPFNGGESSYSETEINKVKDTVWPDGVLAYSYDAATQSWGGAWRMPTQDEFTALLNLSSKDWTANYNSTGVKGRVFSDGTNSVFFPAAGWGDGAMLCYAGSDGRYCSSSLLTDYYPDGTDYAIDLLIRSNSVSTDYFIRRYGQSVRPVSVSN